MILLDTCAIIWDALDPAKLSARASSAIARADRRKALIIADISIWEIAMLMQRSRLEISTTAADFMNLYLQSRNIAVIAISPEIAELSTQFGNEINSDPADRLIAATAIVHNAQLVSADTNLQQASLLDTLW